jgi:hypothetical protein
MVQEEHWDIALLAVKRSAFILFRASQQVPALEEAYKVTSSILGYSKDGESLLLLSLRRRVDNLGQ